MMSKACTISLLLVCLSATSVLGSAIKGQPQVQPVQRLEEQAVRTVKSPVQQYSDRSPKSSPVAPAQSNAPVLESSKKVYNDESLRVRSVQQPAVVEQPAVKSASAPVPVVEPVAPVVAPVAEPAKPVAAPVVAPAPVVKESAPVVPPQAPAVAQPQPVAPVASPPVVEGIKPTFVEQPAAVPAAVPAAAPVQPAVVKAEELPAQSERSAPVKEEAMKPSVVVVEQVVPAKAPVVEPQQAPAVIKPVEPVVQAAPADPAVPAAQPVEPVESVKPVKPVEADSPLMAKKDEPVAVVKESAEPIEVPAPDPGLVLSEPIDSTTKLLIDLDEHVQKFLPAEDKQEPAAPAKNQVLVSGVDYSPPEAQPSGKSSVPLVPYSSSSSNVDSEPIVPPLPSLEKVEKASGAQSSPAGAVAPASPSGGQSATRQANHQHQNQQQIITQLLDQLDSLQNRIQDTINQLVARRRYVMSALLRPMGTYVRRVRTNLERLQNRVNQLQAAAVSVGNNNNQNRPGFVDAAAIETIRRRIDDISKRISDIVNRIRFSLTPTSAPLNNGR